MTDENTLPVITVCLRNFILNGTINEISISSPLSEVFDKIGMPSTHAGNNNEINKAVVWGYGKFFIEFKDQRVSKIVWSSHSTIPPSIRVKFLDFDIFHSNHINDTIKFLESNHLEFQKRQCMMYSKKFKKNIPSSGNELIINNRCVVDIKFDQNDYFLGMSCVELASTKSDTSA